MTYHRHISRVMFVLVVLHSVAFTIEDRDYYSQWAAEPYFTGELLLQLQVD